MFEEALTEPLLRRIRRNKALRYIPVNSALCDIGCGLNGDFLRSISHKISMGIGIDKKVTPYHDNKIKLMRVDIGKGLSLESEMFDSVTLLAVLEHLEHPYPVLKECYRILKPAGVLVLTTPTPLSKPLLEFLSFKLRIISREEVEDHKHYFTGREIKTNLEIIGFQSVVSKTFLFKLNRLVVAYKGIPAYRQAGRDYGTGK